MKTCGNCEKEIPDSALHCVFCGNKQADAAHTVLGYPGLADDVLARANEQQAAAAQAPTAGPPPATRPAERAPTPTPTPTPAPAAGAPPATRPATDDTASARGAASDDAHAATQPVEPVEPSSPAALDAEPEPASTDADLPPYLASETDARMNAPVEPWARTLPRIALAMGVLSLLASVTPWAFAGGETLFGWTVVTELDGALSLTPVFTLLAGLAGIACGVAPMRAITRGIIASAAGIVPVLLFAGSGGALRDAGGTGEFQWRLFIVFAGMLAISLGFLLRAQYRDARVSRVLLSATAALVALAYIIPAGGSTMIGDLLGAVASRPLEHKLLSLYMLAPLGLALLGLVAWAPASTGAGTGVFTWLALLWAPVLPLLVFLSVVLSGRASVGAALMFVYHLPVSLLTWYALGAFGLASIVGKQLEEPETGR